MDVNYSLILAVREGNLERVRELINSFGLSYSPGWSEGYVLLRDAVEYYHAAVAKLLLSSGSRVNSKSIKPTNTPLHFAVINGDIELVKLLLDKGANIVARKDGITPLHCAIFVCNPQITELLLKHRADVNASDNNGRRPLYFAAEKGCLQIAEQLIDYGAYIECVCTSRWNKNFAALHIAVNNYKKELITLLLSRGANVNAKGDNSITPLHIAAMKGYVSIAEDLLNHGACIHSLTLKEGYTPLHFAAERGTEKSVKLFLNRGADINATTKGNLTSLHIATKSNNRAVVKLLLERGAEVDSQDKDGNTVLLLAIERNSLQIVKDILKFCPDVNNQSNRRSFKIAVFGEMDKEITETFLAYGLFVKPEDANDHKLFYTAVEKGYLKIVGDLLKYGANVNMLGFTPLHRAVEYRQEEVAKLLISYDADINAQDECRKTPIFYAIENADLKMTNLLLSYGANIKDPKLLIVAIESNFKEMVEAILQHDVDINARDESGRTLLEITVSKCYIRYMYSEDLLISIKGDIVKLLLSKGANVDTQTFGRTILHAAAENGYEKVVEALLEYNANVNCRGICGVTPLHCSARRGNEVITRMLLNSGANVNAKKDDGYTALHIAVEMGRKEVVKILLEGGAKVDSKSKYDITPLHLGAEKGHEKVVEALLEYNANVNCRGSYGVTPLRLSARGGYEVITRMLLNSGANVDAKQEDGFTALLFAAKMGRKEVVKILIEGGANVDAKQEDGYTALHFAAEMGRKKIVKILLEGGAKVASKSKYDITPLHLGAEKGHEKVVEALLEYNANVNCRGSCGVTPLHLSARRGNEVITRMLLNSGANVNAKQEDGFTALHIAAEMGRKEVVKILLEGGAKVDSKSEYDITPLHLGAEKGYREIIETILKFGADINCREKNGRTALHIAAQKGHPEVVTTLLEHGSDINITCRNNLTALNYTPAWLKLFYSNMFDYNLDCGISSHEATARALKRHIVKMKTANLFVSNNNLVLMSSSGSPYVVHECEEEIARMKSEKIRNTKVSYYDILAKSTSSLAIFMRNENIVMDLKSDDYKTKFPIYAGMVGRNFRIGMERNELLEEVNKLFHLILKNIPNFPPDCTDEIFSYLNNEDLRILMGACEPLSTSSPNKNIKM